MRTPASDTELVVLIGPDGRPAGTHPKATVHTTNTPLHYAFSCYLTRPDGQVLLTRRALAKPTWPGVWTNSMCGHPGPGETPEAALRRRASQELGISPAALDDARLILPDFSYRATDSSGIVEWEVCPVFMAVVAGEIAPNPGSGCPVPTCCARSRPRPSPSAPGCGSNSTTQRCGRRYSPPRMRLTACSGICTQSGRLFDS